MANTQLTIDMITKECLRILVNTLSFTKQINREYDSQFAVSGAKIGDTLRIRKPARYIGRTGAALSTEDHTEKKEDLVLTTQFGVDATWSSKELTLEMDDFSKRHLVPAMATIANKIDYDGMKEYQNVANQVGTAGVTPATALIVLQAGQKMDEDSTPRDMLRSLVVNPAANATIVDALKGLFHASPALKDQFMSGNMGRALGFKWSMDQNVRVHTTGTFTTGSTPLVKGASQTGNSLITDGWAASTLVIKAGDTFTLASVNAVNPQNRASTGASRRFVATADGTSDASGDLTISIFPAIQISTSQFATVDVSPADDAVITMNGTEATEYPINMAFHRDAFTLGTADLVLPSGVDMASRQVYEGISMRIVKQYTISDDKFPTRIDVLYGWKTLYGELACRLIG